MFHHEIPQKRNKDKLFKRGIRISPLLRGLIIKIFILLNKKASTPIRNECFSKNVYGY
jgi:hypothetical protein